MWFSHKNRFDYAGDFEKWHRKDFAAMAEKDFNHPCVIMYSIGNEVSESVTKEGIAAAKEMTELLHRKDPTRPVTCGTNIMLNYMRSIGAGVYQEDDKDDKKEERKRPSPKKEKKAGSEFINAFIAKTGEMVDTLAKFEFVEKPSRPLFSVLDICGYNYASSRYEKDARLHPERLIVGSETFPPRIVRNWRLVKSLPNVIATSCGPAGIIWERQGSEPGAIPMRDGMTKTIPGFWQMQGSLTWPGIRRLRFTLHRRPGGA